MARRVGRVIALLFHDRGTRRGCVVSSTPRPHFTPGERPGTHFYRKLCRPQGWSGREENLVPTGIRSRNVQPVAQSLYRLSYRAHRTIYYGLIILALLVSLINNIVSAENAIILSETERLLRRAESKYSGLEALPEFEGTIAEACGPGSSVGIATGYGLEGPGIESR